MTPNIIKYDFQIKVESFEKKEGKISQIKQDILTQHFRRPSDNTDFSFDPLFLKNVISTNLKRKAFENGLNAYIADYDEREGSLLITFILIVESWVVYEHLTHFARKATEELEKIFSVPQYRTSVTHHLIHSPTIKENKLTKKSIIWTSLISTACLLIALTYFLTKYSEEKHKEAIPIKYEIKVESVSSKDNEQTTTENILKVILDSLKKGKSK